MSGAWRLAAAFLALAAIPATPIRPGGSTPAVSYIPASEVMSAFSKGAVLLSRDNFMVHASRREGPGQAEVHLKDTDIIYVLDGAATVVTGGEAADARQTEADEMRGASIRGGDSRRLEKGDLLVVPNGVPHWFREVRGPFLYYVVKVR